MSTQTLKRRVAFVVAGLVIAGTALPAVSGPSGAQAQATTDNSIAPATRAAFNKDLQVMHAQMMQLRSTHDQAARMKLLADHMHTMQNTLHMMMGQGGMRGGAGGMGPGMMQGGNMRGADGMMGNSRMMQMMMNQMMQHQQAMQGMGCGN
ncbi:MAG: hypothetical protein PF446_05360 [Oleiagrimonas sp.]|jgi:hypothetical protein|nr:hypothetical protein [Oleiagrimonas sp.]